MSKASEVYPQELSYKSKPDAVLKLILQHSKKVDVWQLLAINELDLLGDGYLLPCSLFSDFWTCLIHTPQKLERLILLNKRHIRHIRQYVGKSGDKIDLWIHVLCLYFYVSIIFFWSALLTDLRGQKVVIPMENSQESSPFSNTFPYTVSAQLRPARSIQFKYRYL